jgi:hypothetical protein
MRAARVINWIALILWLVSLSVATGYYVRQPSATLVAVPISLAHLVYYGSSSSWLRWSAIVSNALYGVLGLLMGIGTLIGLLYPWAALTLSLCLLALPGGLNAHALFRERRVVVDES